MDKRTIRIRISIERLEILYNVCDDMKELFIPKDQHGHLLREYKLDLHQKLHKMVERKQDQYVLRLSSTEAEAFFQLWKMMDLKGHRYAKIIVDTLMHKMSALAA